MRKDRPVSRRSTTSALYSAALYSAALSSVMVLSALLSAVCWLGAGEIFAAEEAEAETPGQAAFLANKCNLCHAVPAVAIEAKTKSEKMKGADLGGPVEGEFAVIAAYVRKQGELEGKSHKKEFKGTDEELQAILDWLAELEPAAAEGS